MNLNYFKHYDEKGRMGLTLNMIDVKDELYEKFDYHTKQRFNSFVKFIASKHEMDDFSEVIYFGIDDKVTVKCEKHDYYQISPYHYMKYNRCPYCGHNQMTKNKFPNLILKSEYKNTHNDVTVLCKLCKTEKTINAMILLNSKFGCNCLNNKKTLHKRRI